MARPSEQLPRELFAQRILGPDGKLVGPEPHLRSEELIELYRWMVVGRTFDQRAVSLQRQGRIGTYAPLSGQEAAQIGTVKAMRQGADWMFPTYREYAAMYAFGMPMKRMFMFPMGHPLGGIAPEGVHIYPISIIIASHLPHAVGAAYALRTKGKDGVCVAFHGDGATSEGDFHEALNFAGVFSLPIVFVCQNNGWAISVPRHRQTASATLAQKALAFGVRGVQVDGNDVLAVYVAVNLAMERARRGEGPTLVEAVTYRMGPHTTADDPTRYRSAEEHERMAMLDPILRFRAYLSRLGVWDEDKDKTLNAEVRDEVGKAVQAAEAEPRPPQDFFFDQVFETPTPSLIRQRTRFVPEGGEA